MKMFRILHEYVILWQKPQAIVSFLGDLGAMARQQSARLTSVWRVVVHLVLQSLGGKADLTTIYSKVAEAAPERLASNPNWKAKVRQVLNQNRDQFASTERGVWSLAG
jgi:hypothetical protein